MFAFSKAESASFLTIVSLLSVVFVKPTNSIAICGCLKCSISSSVQGRRNRGGQGGHDPPPLFFKAKKEIDNNNRNKLKIHNITP